MITYGSTTLTSYNSIVKTEVYYYKSTSPTALSGGSWSTAKPTWESGKYVWQKIRTIYEDETYTESDPVNITGQQGATGSAAYSYKLNASDTAVTVSKTGEYSVNKIIFTATYKQGTGAVTAYAGRFKIETTLNGTTWTTAYTSSGNESSKQYTLPENIISIRCSLYQAGGTSILLDITTIPIVKDGVDAIGLRDSIPYYLASDKQTGVTRLDQGWTRFKPELTTEKRYLWVYYVSRYSEGDTQPELIEIKNDIVSFENHGGESPVENCVIDIEPVQDLHGYDSPWADGGGVNLAENMSPSLSDLHGITVNTANDGTITINGTNDSGNTSFIRGYFHCPDQTATYTWAVFNAAASTDLEFSVRNSRYNPAGGWAPLRTANKTLTFTINSGETAVYWQFQIKKGAIINNVTLKPMIISGSAAPTSYSPYSNICPISGWTGANVSRVGKNWFNSNFSDYTRPYNYYICPIKLIKGERYKLKAELVGTAITGVVFGIVKSGNRYEDFVGPYFAVIANGEAQEFNFVVDDTFTTPNLVAYVSGETQFNEVCNNYNISLMLASESYEPYQGNTYSVDWQSEAGTVYGGTLDVTTGELTVDKAIVDLGTLTWTLNNHAILGDYFYASIYNLKVKYEGDFSTVVYTNMCSAYSRARRANTSFVNGTFCFDGNTGGQQVTQIQIKDSNYANAADFKSAMSGVQVCYKLAEPTIYQLTPQEITMLTGQNYIFSSTGQTAISYYDKQTSTNPYIDYSATSTFEVAQSVSDAIGVLESPYKEVEWVESNGKQYVYLDWKPPIKTWGFEIDFISRNAVNSSQGAWNESTNANGYGTIFGVRNASGVNNVQLSSYNNGLLRLGNGNNVVTGFKTDHSRQTIKLHGTTLTKIDGTTTTVTRTDENTSKPYCNMTVFCLYEGLRRASTGSISEPSSTRIYSLKFYDGDTLTVDLVGAIRKADNITGLYDKVSKHFYPAPGMLFGDTVGDIPITDTITDALNKNDVKCTVVNKNCSRMWETAVPFNRLEDGQKITITYSYGTLVNSVQTSELVGWDDTSSNSNVYLRLIYPDGVKSEWIPCYYSQTSRLSTHYGAGTPITLTYHENILSNATETAAGSSIVRGFFANPSYYQNTSYTQYSAVKAGANGIKGYTLAMRDSENTWSCFYSGAYKGTNTGKVAYTGGFILGKVIYSSGAGAQTSNSSLDTYYNYKEGVVTSTNYDAYSVDLRYSTNCATTLIAQRPVYLVGTVENDGLFHLDVSQWWTQTEPTFKDNKVYVYLGVAYSTYQIWLSTDNPAYMFYNDKFILYDRALTLQDIDSLKETLESQIDGKVETWCQKSNPASSWSAEERPNHTGDLWYYIGESDNTYKNNTTYQYNGNTNTWTAYSANPDLFDKIDGKIDIYYGKSTITGAKEGDYLVDDTDGSTYRYDASKNKWVKVTDYKTTITNAIDDIEIGGRNLLIKKELGIYAGGNITYDTNKISATETGVLANGLTTGSQIPGWKISGLTGNVNIIVHGITNLPSKAVVLYYTCWNGTTRTKAQANFSQQSVNSDGSFEYKATLEIPSESTHIALGFGQLSASTYELSSLKLEKGTKATDWTPAPEDVDANIQQVQTNLDNLEIGGRNLLLNSGEHVSTSYRIFTYPLSSMGQELQEGDVFTFSMKATIPSDRMRWAIYNSGGTVAIEDWQSITPDGTNAQIYTLTGQWKITKGSTVATNTSLFLYIGTNESTSQTTVHWAKLERGNKSTSWTPAPEDTDASIQQVQTNLDNLEIGGRNLLKNSKALTTNWTLDQATVTDGIVTITPTTNTDRRMYQMPANGYWTWTVGQEYTVSVDARSDNGASFWFMANGAGKNSSAISVTSNWQRYSFTFTAVNNSTGSMSFSIVETSNKTIQFKEPKLEYGGKATSWTPAPEDTQADINTAIAQSVEYIIGTQTAATGTWTGRASTLSELKDGTQIRYWLPYAGSGNATLNLTLKDGTATGAIPVYRQGGSASSTGVVTANRVTTHFPAGTSISMVYGINRVVSAVYSGTTYTDTFTGWFADGAYDSGNTYNRTRMQNAITAVTAITSGRIICGTILGYKNIGAGIQFDLSYPLLYAASAITAGKTGDNNFLQINSISVTGNGTVQSGAAKKELYLKGTVTGNTFTIASSPFMTTVIPTSTDGFYYIPLGMMYSTTAIYFTSSNRLYAYLDGAFQSVDIAAVLKANSAYDTAVQAQSEIVQTRQTLSLQIRDISVGGANLFEKTKAFEDTANEMTAHDLLTEFTYKDLAIRNANSITFNDQVVELSAYKYTDLTSDMWYTFSFYAKGGLDIGFMYAGTGNATIDNIIVSWSDETYTGFNATSTTSNIIWLTPTTNWQRYNIVFHVAEQEITASQRLIGLYARPTSNYTELTTEASETLTLESSTDSHFIMEGNEISICGYKLELGNKPTDWTPSEKDKTSYNNIISQINLSQEGVSIKADKINLEGTITANNGFIIDEYGNMTANNGTFNGLFESYATEINENTFDMKISNGHIHFYNNDRTLTEDERHVGYIGGVRNTTSYVNDNQKNNDGIMIRLYNTNDFVISSYKNNINKKVLEVVNHENDSISVDFWDDLHIYSGRNINLYAYQDSQYPELQFYRHSKNTNKYTLKGSLSLHSVTDNNSDISDRLYLWAKNQGSDLAGDQFLYFAGKGLKYTSNGQSIRNGYVVTDKYIVTQYFNLSDQTIAKNTSKNFTIDVTRDGYTPIMFVPRATSGMNAAYLSIYNWALSGNTANIYTHNISTTEDITNITIWVQVLYKLTY